MQQDVELFFFGPSRAHGQLLQKCHSDLTSDCVLDTSSGAIGQLSAVHAIGHRRDQLTANKSLHALSNDGCERHWSESLSCLAPVFFFFRDPHSSEWLHYNDEIISALV